MLSLDFLSIVFRKSWNYFELCQQLLTTLLFLESKSLFGSLFFQFLLIFSYSYKKFCSNVSKYLAANLKGMNIGFVKHWSIDSKIVWYCNFKLILLYALLFWTVFHQICWHVMLLIKEQTFHSSFLNSTLFFKIWNTESRRFFFLKRCPFLGTFITFLHFLVSWHCFS